MIRVEEEAGMEEGARVVVAHLFQRSGRRELSESELANAMSLDLGWFPPRTARDVVAGFLRAGLIEHTDDGDLRPRFDPHEVRVPLGFRPPPTLARELPPPGAAAPRDEAPAAVPETGSMERPGPPDASGSSQPTSPPPEEGPRLDLPALLARFSEASGEEPGVWVARMERIVQTSGDVLVPEVALLVAAAQEGNDVRALAARLRAGFESENA